MKLVRGIMIKAIPAFPEVVDEAFDRYGAHITKATDMIAEKADEFEDHDEKGTCAGCDREKKLVKKRNDDSYCQMCYESDLKDIKAKLAEMEPKIERQTFYYAVIERALKGYKSYATKAKERNEEIARAKDKRNELEGMMNAALDAADPVRKRARKGYFTYSQVIDDLRALDKESANAYRRLRANEKIANRRRVAFPVFRNNEIFFWKNMMQFEEIEDGWTLSLNALEKGKHHLFTLDIGKYQEAFIRDCIAQKMHQVVYPKLVRKEKAKQGFEYFFILPFRDVVDLPVKKTDIEQYMKEHASDFVMLSFGIKRPVTAAVFRDGERISRKTFSTGNAYWKKFHERGTLAKMRRAISYRTHRTPETEKGVRAPLRRKKHVKLRRLKRQTGFKVARYVNTASQTLSHRVVSFAKGFRNPVIVVRDTRGVKAISYPHTYRRELALWPLEQQKSMVEYKAHLAGIPFYKLPYRALADVACSRCGKATKEKMTTLKILHATQFSCEACKQKEDFYLNECRLFHSLIREILGRLKPLPGTGGADDALKAATT